METQKVMRFLPQRLRQWSLVMTGACVLLYVLAASRLERNPTSDATHHTSHTSVVQRVFTWLQFKKWTYSRKSADEFDRAQIECRSDIHYAPRAAELITNRHWVFDWDDVTLRHLTSDVDTNTTDTLNLAPLPYLKNFKNPCWLELLETGRPYDGRDHKFQFTSWDFRVDPSNYMTRAFEFRVEKGRPFRMRCLPYYFLIGPQKTGTTDFFEKLHIHPLLKRGRLKEPHYWPRSKNENNITLDSYIDLFDETAESIAASYVACDGKQAPYHPLITGEATPETIWDNWFWRKTPENAGFDDVTYLQAHHIRHVIPQARILAILRDPVDRLLSDFYYFSHRHAKTPETLHMLAEQAVGNLSECYHVNKKSRHACIYDQYGPEKPRGDIWDPRARLRMGLYAEFLEDWFDIFPEKQIFIVNFDDYVANRTTVLNRVYDFLGIEPLSIESSRYLNQAYVSNQGHNYASAKHNMLPETDKLLREFYAPFNSKLARITKNNDFVKWNHPT